MREIGSYSAAEWLTISPLVHRFKYVRNRAVERFYRSQGATERNRFLTENAHKVGRKIVATIAFNTPWVIELFLRAGRLNLPETSILVADNSSKTQASAEIRACCAEYGAAYVRLPRNPEWHPNRSHGLAMNWAYHNMIKPLDPDAFAFFDHDLFALSPFDIAEAVSDQPVYGFRKQAIGQDDAWSLWAGYSIYDNAAVKSRDLDFNYDRPLQLDTGGYNWPRLYRFLDAAAMTFASHRNVELRDPNDGCLYQCLLLDTFIHVTAASHSTSGKDPRRIAFYRHLIEHIEAGNSWSDLITPE